MKSFKLLLLFFVLISFWNISFADVGKPSIDSLQASLKSSNKPVKKASILIDLVNYYIPDNIDSAKVYLAQLNKFSAQEEGLVKCEILNLECSILRHLNKFNVLVDVASQAINCAVDEDQREIKLEALGNLGYAYARLGKLRDARKIFLEELALRHNDIDSTALIHTYMNLGTVSNMLGDYSSGIDSYYEVLEYYKNQKDYSGIAKVYNNIGLSYSALKQIDTALEYYELGLESVEKIEAPEIENQLLANIAGVHTEKGNYKLAMAYLEKGLKMAQDLGDNFSIGIFFNDMAKVKNQLGLGYEALDAINQAIALNEEMQAVNEIAANLTIKSTIELRLSKYNAAFNTCKKCYTLVEKSSNIDIRVNALECLAKSAKTLGRYDDAFEYQQQLNALSDSVNTNLTLARINNLEQESKLVKEKAILEKENFISEAKLREEKANSKFFLLMSIISLLALGFLGLFLFNSSRQSKKIKSKNKEIEIANKNLSDVNKKLELTNAKLNNFTSVAAHDLKSPLRTISSYSQLLAIRNEDRFEEKDMEMLNFVSTSTKQLSQMIDDLLAFSNLNEDLKPAEEFAVNDIVATVKNNLKADIANKNVDLLIEGDLGSVKAHKSLITQLFQNLISNGIKFRKKDSLSVIKIMKIGTDDKSITYSISDNGIGIKPQYFDKIFNLFQRLSSSHEGNGIGLATCKSIVDFYGQKIWLESEVGTGTSFYFSLPK